MKTALTKNHMAPYTHEDENFWRKHASDFSTSGLTKKSYSDKTGINYARFFYWIKKLSPSLVRKTKNIECFDNDSRKEMLPVQLRHESGKIRSNLLCLLHLKNGCVLHICDQEALRFILEKWS